MLSHPNNLTGDNLMKVANKVIVVTGAGSGIGRELVLALLKKGARVAAIDFNEVTLKEIVALTGQHGDKVSSHMVNAVSYTHLTLPTSDLV